MQDELRRLLDVPGDHLRRRAPAARRLLPLRLLQLGVLHLVAADGARLRPRHRLLPLRHPQDAAGAARHRRRSALLHPRLRSKPSFVYVHTYCSSVACKLSRS